jgi:hypothetical protein
LLEFLAEELLDETYDEDKIASAFSRPSFSEDMCRFFIDRNNGIHQNSMYTEKDKFKLQLHLALFCFCCIEVPLIHHQRGFSRAKTMEIMVKQMNSVRPFDLLEAAEKDDKAPLIDADIRRSYTKCYGDDILSIFQEVKRISTRSQKFTFQYLTLHQSLHDMLHDQTGILPYLELVDKNCRLYLGLDMNSINAPRIRQYFNRELSPLNERSSHGVYIKNRQSIKDPDTGIILDEVLTFGNHWGRDFQVFYYVI